MTNEEYQELNNYLADICNYLYESDWMLINNMEPIAIFNSYFRYTMRQYEFKRDYKQNNLTFKDVYLLTREIIESINPKYLENYDKLLSSGELDFDYEDEFKDSCFRYFGIDGKIFSSIELKRNFNYQDVVTLVHEYMHYTNCQIVKDNENNHLLTEYISIYFEMYAKDYLINKGIPKEEFLYNDRLLSSYNYGINISNYEIILLAYQRFGNIDENTYKDLNDGIIKISKDEFDKECKNFLEKCRKLEKEYQQDILYEKGFDQKKYAKTIAGNIDTDYRYLFGTVFAIYTKEFGNMENVIKLNDNLNNEMYSFEDLLNMVNIDLSSSTLRDDLLSSLKKYIEKYDNKVIK